jgi:hypothetical protein
MVLFDINPNHPETGATDYSNRVTLASFAKEAVKFGFQSGGVYIKLWDRRRSNRSYPGLSIQQAHTNVHEVVDDGDAPIIKSESGICKTVEFKNQVKQCCWVCIVPGRRLG